MNTICSTLTPISSKIVSLRSDEAAGKFYVFVDGRKSKARTFDTLVEAQNCFGKLCRED